MQTNRRVALIEMPVVQGESRDHKELPEMPCKLLYVIARFLWLSSQTGVKRWYHTIRKGDDPEMVGRPKIKGKRHFVKHTTDSGRSPEYPECLYAELKGSRIKCTHPGCGEYITTCYVRHLTAKNTGMCGFRNDHPCPVDADL
jgi:hypothetical protein